MNKEQNTELYKAPCFKTIAVFGANLVCTSLGGQTEDLDNSGNPYEW